MGGAKLFCLFHDLNGIIMRHHGGAHLIRAMACHNHGALRRESRPGGQRMYHERCARQRVKHLGQVGIHPRAFACGEDDECSVHGFSLCVLLRPCLSAWGTGARARHIKLSCGLQHLVAVCRRSGRGGLRFMKTVIFDLDGTLADTSGDLIAAANVCFRDMGAGDLLDARADAGTALRGGRAMLRLGMARLERAEDEATIDRYYPVLLEAYAAAIDTHTVLYPACDGRGRGAENTRLRRRHLHQQARRSGRNADDAVGRAEAFGSLVGADTLAVRKPDPEPLFEAARRAGGHPDMCILIGDSDTDRNTARAAGVPSVLVTFGPAGGDMAALEPEALLDDYADLPGIAARLLA